MAGTMGTVTWYGPYRHTHGQPQNMRHSQQMQARISLPRIQPALSPPVPDPVHDPCSAGSALRNACSASRCSSVWHACASARVTSRAATRQHRETNPAFCSESQILQEASMRIASVSAKGQVTRQFMHDMHMCMCLHMHMQHVYVFERHTS